MVTMSLLSESLHLEEPPGATTLVIFNQEGTMLASREPAESDCAPGTCVVTKSSRGSHPRPLFTRGETEAQGGAVADPGLQSEHHIPASPAR